MSNVLRNIPSASDLLESPPLKSLVNRFSRNVVVTRVRQFLDDMRTQVQTAAANMPAPSELAQRIADWIASDQSAALAPVINATGVIVHAELGRAPLAEEAIQAIAAAARGYTNLELDLASGERCPRVAAVESLLTKLTGAEAATVVNNNAAATLLSCVALAAGREVIVSRGQLIKIDSDLSLPQFLATSGATLREVGTTNKTRIEDYAAAITPQAAVLLRVHSSNYAVVGSTEETTLAELIQLGRANNLPVIDDIGSGALVDLSRYGISGEPLVAQSVRAGADLVLFSGDKLLGGPQCGIIAGRRSLIDKIEKHPRVRAVRADKLTLAALAATLRLYENIDLAERSIPVLSLLATPLENLRQRAERLAPQMTATGVVTAATGAGQSYVMGDALPNHAAPTIRLELTPQARSAEQLAAALRGGTPAIVGRIEDGKVLLDLRSVQPRDDLQLVAAIEGLRPAVPSALPAD